MRGRHSDSDEELSRGLQKAMQGAEYVPAQRQEELAAMSIEELDARLFRATNFVAAAMIETGWTLIELKRRLVRGEFKAHLIELRFSYSYATQCMRVARAINLHPGLAKIPDTHLLRQIASLPYSEQEAIEVKFKVVTERFEDGKEVKKTEEWNALLPWVLSRLGANSPKNHTEREAPPLPQYPEPEWHLIEQHFDATIAAINAFRDYLARVTMTEAFLDRAMDMHLGQSLVDRLGEVVMLLHPPEDVTRIDARAQARRDAAKEKRHHPRG